MNLLIHIYTNKWISSWRIKILEVDNL